MGNQIVTGLIRINYPHLLAPKKFKKGGAEKYGCVCLINKNDEKTLNDLRSAVNDIINDDANALSDLSDDQKMEVADKFLGDGDAKDIEAYKNCYLVNSNNTEKPKILDKAGNEITLRDEIYAGVIARVIIDVFAYKFVDQSGGSKYGIASKLIAVQKIRDYAVIDNSISEQKANELFNNNKYDEEIWT